MESGFHSFMKNSSGHLLLDARYLLGSGDTMISNVHTVSVTVYDMEFIV